MILPINIEDLLLCQGVESSRIEFKATWDEKNSGPQILKTICAFANDLQNLNGGYIVIGVEEHKGCAVFPPKGVRPEEVDRIQKWVRGNCNRIDPEYQPVLSPEIVESRQILVIWIPGSDVRPHRAPDGEKGEKKFFVRLGSETVDAEKNGVLRQLVEQTARVPFDDRRALQGRIEDIRETKVREFLNDIRSGLLDEDNTRELYRKLRIAEQVNGHDAPKNIGLLCFSNDPETWFRGARIEIVRFAGDASGDILEERRFQGGVHEQLRDALVYLEGESSMHLQKQSDSVNTRAWSSFPAPALREALVNAAYHRSYEHSVEPVKVYLYPDRIEVISYPGPVQGIEIGHLRQEIPMPPVPARNRRIGEILKELRLAESRGTGLPKIFRAMRENGSPDPHFDFDVERTYFRLTLPAHPEYIAISALRDAAHLRAVGDEAGAFLRIETAWKQAPGAPALSAEYVRLLGVRGDNAGADSAFTAFLEAAPSETLERVTELLEKMRAARASADSNGATETP